MQTVSTETIITHVFLFWKVPNLKLKSSVQVQDNESLANFAYSSSTEEYWPSVVFVRASVKCSLVWPSGWLEFIICSYRGIHLLWWQLKWTRDSWFHFDILKKNLRWCGGHGPQGEGRGILLVGVASPSAVETFLFLWEKIKRKKTIKNCDNWRLLQGDDTQLTTILARSKFITLLP